MDTGPEFGQHSKQSIHQESSSISVDKYAFGEEISVGMGLVGRLSQVEP
jgi:hypothetical protein